MRTWVAAGCWCVLNQKQMVRWAKHYFVTVITLFSYLQVQIMPSLTCVAKAIIVLHDIINVSTRTNVIDENTFPPVTIY
jgi:hypothetical protein